MKKDEVNLHIPIIFQRLNDTETTFKSEDSEDTRFMEVKIWLMHLGENLNKSYFSKENVKKAIPSLANTPILGYVEADKDGEEDFSDHRQVIVKKDGKYEVKYIGQAYGVIPEDSQAQFEKRVGDDGIEREYLTCRGLVWRKNDEAIDIFEKDGVKSQSMELHEEFDGFVREDGLFEFTDFKFFGACALGDSVQPAMTSSTIEPSFSVEKEFSYEKMFEDINSKVESFKFAKANLKEKEGGNNKMPEEKFTATSSQLTSELRTQLRANFEESEWGFKVYDYHYVDHNNSHVFAQSRSDEYRLVGIAYNMNGDVPELDYESKKLYKVEFTPVKDGEEVNFNLKSEDLVEFEINTKAKEVEKEVEEKFTAEKEVIVGEKEVEIQNLQTEFTNVKEEVESLRNKISEYQTKERKEAETALFTQFEAMFEKDDIEFTELQAKASDFEIADLEKELFALVGRKKANFSAPKSKEVNKIPVDKTEEKPASKYGFIGEKYAK